MHTRSCSPRANGFLKIFRLEIPLLTSSVQKALSSVHQLRTDAQVLNSIGAFDSFRSIPEKGLKRLGEQDRRKEARGRRPTSLDQRLTECHRLDGRSGNCRHSHARRHNNGCSKVCRSQKCSFPEKLCTGNQDGCTFSYSLLQIYYFC